MLQHKSLGLGEVVLGVENPITVSLAKPPRGFVADAGNVLKEHGFEPAGDRKRQNTRKTFIKSHWDMLAAIDFTTIEVWTIEVWTTGGLITYYRLFVMDIATRRVHLAACTPMAPKQTIE